MPIHYPVQQLESTIYTSSFFSNDNMTETSDATSDLIKIASTEFLKPVQCILYFYSWTLLVLKELINFHMMFGELVRLELCIYLKPLNRVACLLQSYTT